MGMGQYLLIPFLGNDHPFTSYFDVHQGDRVLTHPHISIVAAQAQYLVQSLPQLSASGAPKERALMVFLSFDRNSLVKGLTISLVGDGKRLEWRWGKGETCEKNPWPKKDPVLVLEDRNR